MSFSFFFFTSLLHENEGDSLGTVCTKTELRKSYHDKAHSSALFNLTGLFALNVNIVFVQIMSFTFPISGFKIYQTSCMHLHIR